MHTHYLIEMPFTPFLRIKSYSGFKYFKTRT